jgi:hypothetical protein
MQSDILKRLTTYDRPMHSDLPTIGIIEFLWQQIVDCLFLVDECEAWRTRVQDLDEAIKIRCPANPEQEQALKYLNELELAVPEKNYMEIAVLLENVKDWAKKSIIRK